jgi:hypothetical protein
MIPIFETSSPFFFSTLYGFSSSASMYLFAPLIVNLKPDKFGMGTRMGLFFLAAAACRVYLDYMFAGSEEKPDIV